MIFSPARFLSARIDLDLWRIRLRHKILPIWDPILHTPVGIMFACLGRAWKFVAATRNPERTPDLNFVTRIFLCGSGPNVLRDFLLVQRTAHIAAAAGKRQVRIFCLAATADDDCHLMDILCLASFCRTVSHVVFIWDREEARNFLRRFSGPAEREPLLAELDEAELDRAEPGWMESHRRMMRDAIAGLLLSPPDSRVVFRPPHMTKVNARSFLKSLGPSTLAVTVSCPRFSGDVREQTAARIAWLRDLATVRQEVPQLRFIVFGVVTPWTDDGEPLETHFIFTRSIGQTLQDELALAMYGDVHIGPFDACAVAAAHASMPMMILWDEADAPDLPAQADLDRVWRDRRLVLWIESLDTAGLRRQLAAYCGAVVEGSCIIRYGCLNHLLACLPAQ